MLPRTYTQICKWTRGSLKSLRWTECPLLFTIQNTAQTLRTTFSFLLQVAWRRLSPDQNLENMDHFAHVVLTRVPTEIQIQQWCWRTWLISRNRLWQPPLSKTLNRRFISPYRRNYLQGSRIARQTLSSPSPRIRKASTSMARNIC